LYDLPAEGGVLVPTIEEGSPVQTAGLMERNVIVALDRRPATSIDDLLRLLPEKRVGVETALTVIRGPNMWWSRLCLRIVCSQSHEECDQPAGKGARCMSAVYPRPLLALLS
jgi:hypothetical protein